MLAICSETVEPFLAAILPVDQARVRVECSMRLMHGHWPPTAEYLEQPVWPAPYT